MSGQFMVMIRDTRYAYGPFDDEGLAERFAERLTADVDPAFVLPLRSPLLELLSNLDNKGGECRLPKPEAWPPHPGQVWQDRNGDRWICASAPQPYLVRLNKRGDDGAEEIWARFGPLTLVQQILTEEEEPPF